MSLTYVSTKMIEQPVRFESLSANQFTSINSNLTAANINVANINNLYVSTASASDLYVKNLTADYFVVYNSTGATFTTADNSKAFHFDTLVGGPLSAVFPNSLPIGFNVSIYNIGSSSITLSTDSGVFNTPGDSLVNSTRNTGMFIYKAISPGGQPGGEFFGVGIFE